MNSSDFFKFLKKNNLYNVYETSKYFTDKYSLSETISLIGEKYERVKTALDLINFRPQDITINCDIPKEEATHEYLITFSPETPLSIIPEGFIGYLPDNPTLLKNKNKYGLICYKITTINPNQEAWFKTTANLLIGNPNLPPTTEDFHNGIFHSANYSKSYYYINRIGGQDVQDSMTFVADEMTESTWSNELIFHETFNANNFYFVIFINLDKSKLYMCAYNENEIILSYSIDTGTLGQNNTLIKVMLNIGWYYDTITHVEQPVNYKLTLYNNILKETKIQDWLKNINLK